EIPVIFGRSGALCPAAARAETATALTTTNATKRLECMMHLENMSRTKIKRFGAERKRGQTSHTLPHDIRFAPLQCAHASSILRQLPGGLLPRCLSQSASVRANQLAHRFG